MSNNIQKEMKKIDIPDELSERSKIGVSLAKKELKKSRRNFNVKRIGIAALFVVAIGLTAIFQNNIRSVLFDQPIQNAEIENDAPLNPDRAGDIENVAPHNPDSGSDIDPPANPDLPSNPETPVDSGPGPNIDLPSNSGGIVFNEDGSISIPTIELRELDGNSEADMIGLIVYNGNIYTQSNTFIDAQEAEPLVGDKLGRTTGTIDEWSSQDAYAEEFASSIGITEVYSVKGYDKGFRIMTYTKTPDNVVQAQFFDNLNGLTIYSGEDVFGKLNITDNVSFIEWQTHYDWDMGIGNFQAVELTIGVRDFIEELNNTKPSGFRKGIDFPSEITRDEDNFKSLIIHLNDGSEINIEVYKEGYIHYRDAPVYFKMDDDIFKGMWNQLD